MPMLETNRLSVRYGTKTIVDSLSFSVSEGQDVYKRQPMSLPQAEKPSAVQVM